MTARGRAVLALGVFCWIAAVVFGSRALYPVAAGLVLAVPLALVWVKLSMRRPHVSRRWSSETVLEGDEVAVELTLTRESGTPRTRSLRGAVLAGLRRTRPPSLRARPALALGPVRPRRGGAHGRGAAGARRLSAARRDRAALLRRRRRPERRPSAPVAAACRIRAAQRPRPPAGRVSATRPLAIHGPAWPADGEGARGLAARRGRRAPGRRRRGSDRHAARLVLRRGGASDGVDHPRPDPPRTPLRARPQHGGAGDAGRHG